MSVKLVALLTVMAGGLLLAAAACGGDGGTEIEVSKGLAAVAGTSAGQEEFAAAAAGGAAAMPAPVRVPPGVRMTQFGAGGDAFAAGLAPLLQQGATGLTVQGFGRASTPAAGASVQLFVGSTFAYYPEPVACPPGEPCPRPEPSSISEEDLEPILAAIRGQGVAEGDIKVTSQPVYGPYEPNAFIITVTMRDLGKLDAIVEAATGATDQSDNVAIQSTNVLYTVGNCADLEREAMRAAAEDASDRVQLLADVLGVGVGDVVAATHYSYSPFGPNPCDPSFMGLEFAGGMPYVPGQSPQVQVIANLTVTFAMR
jgi:hypothetical protein